MISFHHGTTNVFVELVQSISAKSFVFTEKFLSSSKGEIMDKQRGWGVYPRKSTLKLLGMMDYDLVCYDRYWCWRKSISVQQSAIVPHQSGSQTLSSFWPHPLWFQHFQNIVNSTIKCFRTMITTEATLWKHNVRQCVKLLFPKVCNHQHLLGCKFPIRILVSVQIATEACSFDNECVIFN